MQGISMFMERYMRFIIRIGHGMDSQELSGTLIAAHLIQYFHLVAYQHVLRFILTQTHILSSFRDRVREFLLVTILKRKDGDGMDGSTLLARQVKKI